MKKLQISFRTRLFLSILLLVTITFSLGGNLLLYASFSNARSRELENAVNSFRLTQYTAAVAGLNSNDVQISKVTNALRQMHLNSGSALRLRVDGDTVYCSTQPEDRFIDPADTADDTHLITTVLTDPQGAHVLQITGNLPLQNLSVELDGLYPIEPAYEALHTHQHLYREAFCVTILLGALLALLLSHFLTRPLSALSAASKRIADGELDYRAEESGGDEFAALAGDFNHMADELAAKIADLTAAMQRQEEFTGAFAHEMKTPMTSIIGYADMLRSRTLGESDRRTAANYIFTESKRLEQLSVKLLDLLVLRRRDFPLKETDVSRLTAEVVRGMAPMLKKQKIIISGTGQAGLRSAEPDLLKTLVMNLIDNARKSMPDGGEITVVQRLTENGFSICITDTGCGMAPEELSKITDAFYRVDKSRSRAQGGVGLGLAICQEIAALHGGTLSFESKHGSGTSVMLNAGGDIDEP